MPSFDIVSELNQTEIENAVNNSVREVKSRFDLKNAKISIKIVEGDLIQISAENEFQAKQVYEILEIKFSQRKLDLNTLDVRDPNINLSEYLLNINLLSGIDKALSKKISNLIRETKLKVKVLTQAEQLRVSGKKRNDLQDIISKIKDARFNYPLQFKNFKD